MPISLLHRLASSVSTHKACGRHDSKVVRPHATVELLDPRTLFSAYTAASMAELVAAIVAANRTAQSDTITLAAGATIALTSVNNTSHGATGLPVIEARGGPLTITG